MRGSHLVGYIGAVALGTGVVAGCSSDNTGDTAQPERPSVTTHAPAAPTAGGPSAASTTPTDRASANCAVSELGIDIGPGGAAAGTTGFPVIFTNTGGRTCTLAGFPGVSYANGPDGDPIGAAAVRIGDSAGPVTIGPGQQASALVLAVNVQNYPAEKCGPTDAAGLRIYPPDSFDSAFVARPGTACTLPTETTQLKVNPVVAGNTGQ